MHFEIAGTLNQLIDLPVLESFGIHLEYSENFENETTRFYLRGTIELCDYAQTQITRSRRIERVTITLMVPGKCVGMIIGKQNNTRASIEHKYYVQIRVLMF